jgi:hypothetical protein
MSPAVLVSWTFPICLLLVVSFDVEAVNVFRLEIVLKHKSLAIKCTFVKLLGDGANSVDVKEA